ncbi:MAG: DUF2147 domain-containing protein [Taibaiella sp.]|nr:DUF2147 domain-containing protein [Taibaiella sp.]
MCAGSPVVKTGRPGYDGTHKGDHLEVRGYVGISMLGRTTVWTKAE